MPTRIRRHRSSVRRARFASIVSSIRYVISTLLVAALCSGHLAHAEPPLESGKPLRVGTESGIGDFALPSISCRSIGAVRSGDGRRGDLFVESDRWHPGLLWYRWVTDDADGVPVFSQPEKVHPPAGVGKQAVPGYVWGDDSGDIWGLWLAGRKLILCHSDAATRTFERRAEVRIDGLPGNPGRVVVRRHADGSWEGYVTVADTTRHRPGNHRAQDYFPYDGAGIWRGGLPRHGIYRFTISGDWPEKSAIAKAEVILPREQGGLFGINSLEWIRPTPDVAPQLLFGTKLGGLFYVPAASDESAPHAAKVHVTGLDGIALRHPAVGTNMVAYPTADGLRTDLIAAGEGGMYYYRFTGRNGTRGEPVFEQPRSVRQESAELYSGSLIVPNVVDFDGDGHLDIVAGNAAGELLLFRNRGTNAAPRFLPAEPITAGGEPVLIRGAYRGSIQGPGEAHWGYTCPMVVDWNQDGLSDIVMNDIRGMHTVYLNRGTRESPQMAVPKSLNVESLELHGTWRTRPAAGLLGDRMAYVTLDDDDQLHLYWRIDDYNLEEGGKLRLADGSPIQANFLHAGGTGRAKFQFVDWDRDGKTDLLVGTPRHASFPEPERGVPWSMNRAGSAVLLLRNVGTNEQPVYEYPAVMHVNGKSAHFGQHSCAPFATTLGGDNGVLNVIVGTETGRMIFIRGDEIEWIQVW